MQDARIEAKAKGLKVYFTGEPCSSGHVAPRNVADGTCSVCRKERLAKYYQKNRDALLRYYVVNKDRVNKQRRDSRLSDPLRLLRHNLRSRVSNFVLRGGFSKRSKTAAMLGCSWEELAAHLERQFLPGMTWENRSDWHIDHIVPLASAKTDSDVDALNHFTNLRPIWKSDNLAKGSTQTHLI